MAREQNTYTIFSHFVLSDNPSASHALLDYWAEEVAGVNTYGFGNGVVGLGWLIAFLSQNDYLVLDGDTDELLSDVDDNVYKVTLKTVLEDRPDIGYLLKLATFYQQRLATKKSKAHFYRRFTHFECLKLLLGRLDSFLLSNTVGDSDAYLRVDVLLKYSFLLKTCISESLVERAFYKTMEQLIVYFEDFKTLNNLDDKMRLNMSKLLLCAAQYNNPYWVEKLLRIYASIGAQTHTPEQVIWDSLLTSNAPSIIVEKNRGYLSTTEGQRLLFTMYTNIHEFKITNDKSLYNYCNSSV